MAEIIRGQLWKDPRDGDHPLGMIVVTTNGFIRKDMTLVMGAGAARQMADRIPGFDFEAAEAILKWTRTVTGYAQPAGATAYGFMVIREPNAERVGSGIFQVKMHWRNEANLDLIRDSVRTLGLYAKAHPNVAVRMNYPGIGLGRLSRATVEPLLTPLPDNVTVVWR
jgi:hypothetical protein